MICSLFNFCPQCAQSRRHGWALVGLATPNKAPSPQIETWNTINQWSFCQSLECQAPPAQMQCSPYWKLSSNGSESAAYSSFANKKAILPKWNLGWPAQKFGWVKMFDFRRATIFCLRYCLLKHKITGYSKNLAGPWPSSPLATRM